MSMKVCSSQVEPGSLHEVRAESHVGSLSADRVLVDPPRARRPHRLVIPVAVVLVDGAGIQRRLRGASIQAIGAGGAVVRIGASGDEAWRGPIQGGLVVIDAVVVGALV